MNLPKAKAWLSQVKDSSFSWIKTHKKTLFWTLGIMIGLLLILGFLEAYIRFTFLTQDDLQISLSPAYGNIQAEKNVPFLINVSLSTYTHSFCQTVCNTFVYDVYTGEVLESKSVNLSGKDSADFSFTTSIVSSGFGSQLYSVYATCHNVQTTLCKTDAKARHQSTLFVANYSLDEAEIKRITSINNTIQELENVYASLDYTNNLLSVQIAEVLEKRQSLLTSFDKEVAELKKVIDVAHELWDDKEFVKIEEFGLPSFLKQAYILNASMHAVYSSVESDVLKYNDAGAQIDEVLSLEEELASLYWFYNHTNTSMFNSFSKHVDDFENAYFANELVLFEQVNYSNIGNAHDFFLDVHNISLYAIKNQTTLVLQTQQELVLLLNVSFNSSLDVCADYAILENISLTLGSSNVSNGSLKIISTDNASSNSSLNASSTSLSNSSTASFNLTAILFSTLDELYRQTIPLCSVTTNLFNDSITAFASIAISSNNFVVSSKLFSDLLLEQECCAFGECLSCEGEKVAIPVLFVHGHSFNKDNPVASSVEAFAKMQQKLALEEKFVNVGAIDYTSDTLSGWPFTFYPSAVRASYYYISYYDLDIITQSVRKTDGIETYAIRLKELIDIVKANTGSDKVHIVAHSMGGLVTQTYINIFGEDAIDTVIMIGTPSGGISGSILDSCPYFGSDKSCSDMAKGSVIVKRVANLNPKNVDFHVIYGTGCAVDEEDGDGVVKTSSAIVPFATNHKINGSCESFFGLEMHTEMLDPDLYPQVYEIVKDVLVD